MRNGTNVGGPATNKETLEHAHACRHSVLACGRAVVFSTMLDPSVHATPRCNRKSAHGARVAHRFRLRVSVTLCGFHRWEQPQIGELEPDLAGCSALFGGCWSVLRPLFLPII